MQQRTIDISKIYPVAYIDSNGIALSRRGQFTIGYELELPVAYSVAEAEYDDMLNSYCQACKILPAYTIIHRQDVYLYEAYKEDKSRSSFLSQSYERHFASRGRLVHRAYLFICTSSKALVERDGKMSAIFRGYRSGEIEIPSPDKFNEFRNKAAEFISAFCNSGLVKARPLTYEDWVGKDDDPGIVQRFLQLGDNSPIMSSIGLSKDGVHRYDRVAQVYEISESEHLPGEYDSTIRVESLSTSNSEIRLSFASKLGLLLPCEHIVNQYIIIPSQQDIVGSLDRKRRRMFSGITSNDNRINGEELSEYLDDAYRLGLVTIYASANVVVWGSETELLDIRSEISSALTSMNILSVLNTHDSPVTWYAGCPCAETELGQEHLMKQSLTGVLALTGYETFEKGVEGGCLHMCARMTHTPIVIDTLSAAYRNGWISNMNALTVGGSGSGKSFFTNHYVQNCYDSNHHVFIIDVGDSYEGLTNIIREESGGKDGQYYSWSIEHPFTFNPFAGFGSTEEKEEDDDDISTVEESSMNFILSFLKTAYEPKGGWTTTRANILTHMVQGFFTWYEEQGSNEPPIFDDFYNYVDQEVGRRIAFESVYATQKSDESIDDARIRLQNKAVDEQKNGYFIGTARITTEDFNIKEFIVSMQPYSKEGRFGFLLNDRHPKDLFSSRFVVFEVDALQQVDDGTKDKKFYSLCILCIMNAFDKKMRENRTDFKHLIVEEAWQAISNETMAPFLRSLWKTARKFNTSAMVVTQEINDILSNEIIKETIIKNSSIKYLLSQSNNAAHFEQVATYLGLDEKLTNLVLSINRESNPYSPKSKEVFIQLEDKKAGVYSTEVSPQEAIAFESAKDKKAPFLALAKQLGSYIEAIKQLTAEK